MTRVKPEMAYESSKDVKWRSWWSLKFWVGGEYDYVNSLRRLFLSHCCLQMRSYDLWKPLEVRVYFYIYMMDGMCPFCPKNLPPTTDLFFSSDSLILALRVFNGFDFYKYKYVYKKLKLTYVRNNKVYTGVFFGWLNQDRQTARSRQRVRGLVHN